MTTPTNFFLCARNLLDEVPDSAITATVAAVSSLPLSNLKRSSRARVWRNSSAASVVIKVSLEGTSALAANVVGLFRHNLENAGTIRIELCSDYACTTTIYDSGTVAAYDSPTLGDLDWGVDPLGTGLFDNHAKYYVAYFLQNTATPVLGVKITLTDTGNSANYVEASRLFIGKGTELTYNWKTLKLAWKETTKQDRSDGNTLLSDGTMPYREMNVDLEWVSSAQRAALLDMCRFAGMRKDILVAARPGVGGEDERDHTFLARLAAMPDMATLFYDVWQSQFKFVEL